MGYLARWRIHLDMITTQTQLLTGDFPLIPLTARNYRIMKLRFSGNQDFLKHKDED